MKTAIEFFNSCRLKKRRYWVEGGPEAVADFANQYEEYKKNLREDSHPFADLIIGNGYWIYEYTGHNMTNKFAFWPTLEEPTGFSGHGYIDRSYNFIGEFEYDESLYFGKESLAPKKDIAGEITFTIIEMNSREIDFLLSCFPER